MIEEELPGFFLQISLILPSLPWATKIELMFLPPSCLVRYVYSFHDLLPSSFRKRFKRPLPSARLLNLFQDP